MTWFKPNSSMFTAVHIFLADRPVHWIISFTLVLLYSFNLISISSCNRILLLEFERILVNWVDDGNLSADLMSMFGIFFGFFDLLSGSSLLIVYFKLYQSFIQTILFVADEYWDAITETTFLPKSPYVYSDPYLQTISLSAGVSVWKPYEPNKHIHEDSWQ